MLNAKSKSKFFSRKSKKLDPVYSPENIKCIQKSIKQYENGQYSTYSNEKIAEILKIND
ncbi:MAG: hypothetical protein LBL93_03645 [Ruminococcus sp.]|jgi:outer membrane protein assembly factor BamD (BamD/ComL family)|nr:hypothetical protein [Ruminococcus sp.]